MLKAVAVDQGAALAEKRWWLGKEKELSGLHKALSAHLRSLPEDAPDEARTALQTALWHLGVAILQTARVSGSL